MPRNLGEAFVNIKPDASGFRERASLDIKKALAGIDPEVTLKFKMDRNALGQLLKQSEATIEANVNTDRARAQVTSFSKRISALSEEMSHLQFDGDDKALSAKIATFNSRIYDMAEKLRNLTMAGDTSKLDAAIARESAKLAGLKREASSLKLTADDTAAIAQIANLDLRIERLATRMEKMPEFSLQADAAQATLDALLSKVELLRADAANAIKLQADKTQVTTAITASKAEIAALKQQAADISIGFKPGDLLKMHAEILGLEAQAEKLTAVKAPAEAGFMAGVGRTGGGGGGGGFGRFGFGFAGFTLGVAGTTVSGVTLAAHALLDAALVVVPATVAAVGGLGAFAFASRDSARSLYQTLSAAVQVNSALGLPDSAQFYTGKLAPGVAKGTQPSGIGTPTLLGVNQPPLVTAAAAAQFAAVKKSMDPVVVELYGGALNAVSGQLGLAGGAAQTTARYFEGLFARINVAVNRNQGGLHSFWTQAQSDLSKFGVLAQQGGIILGNFFKGSEITGIAPGMLTVLDDTTRALAGITNAIGPIGVAAIISLGALKHYGVPLLVMFKSLNLGIASFIGLIGTVTRSDAVTTAADKIAQAFGRVSSNAKTAAKDVGGVAAENAPLQQTGDLLKLLFTTPGGAVVAGALGAFGLVVGISLVGEYLSQADSKTKKLISTTNDYIDALNKSGHAASGVIAGLGGPNLVSGFGNQSFLAQVKALQPLITAAGGAHPTTTLSIPSGAASRFGPGVLPGSTVIDQTTGNAAALTDEQSKLITSYANVTSAAAIFTAQGYKLNDVLGLMDIAGVQTGDSMDVMVQKVKDLITGWQNAGVQGTALSNGVAAINLQANIQQSKIGQLTDAWSGFIKLVQSAPEAFTGFQLAYQAAVQALAPPPTTAQQAAGLTSPVFHASRSGGSFSYVAPGAGTLTGTAPADLAAQQAFFNANTAAGQQTGAFMTAGAVLGSGTKLSQFGGATVQQLTTEQSKINAAQELNLPGVQQSPAALASIYAMLQQGGLDTTKWKDNWHDINAYVNSATGPLKLTGNLIQQNKSYTDALAVSMANVNNDVMTVAKSIGAIISSAESTAIAAPVVKDIQAIATTIQGSKDWKNTIAQNLTLTPDQLTSVAAPISDMFTQVLSQTGSVDAAKQAVDNYMTNLHFSPAQQRQVDDMISHLFTNDGKTASVDTINNYLKGLHFTGAQITAIDKALGLSPVIKPTVDTSGIKPIVFTFDTVFNAPTGSPLAMQEAALAGFDPSKVKYSFGPGPTVVQTVSGLGSRPTQHGMKLPGYGGGDRIPILAEAGEAIVSKEMTRKYAGVLKAMGVPGMQGGGFIGSASAPYSSPARSGGSGGNVYIGKIEINVPPGVENPTAYGQKVAESLNKHFAAGGSIGSQSYRTKNRDPWYGN